MEEANGGKRADHLLHFSGEIWRRLEECYTVKLCTIHAMLLTESAGTNSKGPVEEESARGRPCSTTDVLRLCRLVIVQQASEEETREH